MIWRLQYAQRVVQYLYLLRHAGLPLRQAIQAIAAEPEPWTTDLAITDRSGRFERNARSHWIGYEVDPEQTTIRIIYVQSF